MATARNQKKWRERNVAIKRQLNVMAPTAVHDTLAVMAQTFNLKSKGEAVTFACFLTDAMIERADNSSEAAQLLADIAESYHRERAKPPEQ